MSTALNITRGLLVATWVFGVYSTWYLFLNNGTADQVNQALAAKPPLLPGTQELLKTSYTGIKPIDDQLALLAVVFYPVLDGSLPHASLWGLMFGGQFAAVYILMNIESARRGNQGNFIAYTVVWGLLVQNVIAACTIPVFALVHLETSPTVSPKPSATPFTINIHRVTTASLSVILGYWVPFVLQALPAPTIIDFESKQTYMFLWQIFPINVGILQYILPLGLSFLESPESKRARSAAASLDSLRPAYVAAFVFAAVCRVTMFTLIVVNTCFPDLFAPEYRGILSVSNVMVAASAFTSNRPPSIGLGNLLLLQYDEQCCAAAWILWSVYIYFQTDSGEKSIGRWATLIGRGLAAWAVAGPAGVAIVCIWGRDELILGEGEDGVKKVQ